MSDIDMRGDTEKIAVQAEAFRRMESRMCDLAYMAEVLSVFVENYIEERLVIRSAGVTHLDYDRTDNALMFAVYNLQRMIDKNKRDYFAAFEDSPKSA